MALFNFFSAVTVVNLEQRENAWANFKQAAFETIYLGGAKHGLSWFASE